MSFFRDDEPEDRAQGRVLPVLPLRDIVVFPHMVVPLFVGRAKSIAALEQAGTGGRELLLVAQRQVALDDPAEGDLFEIGTIGVVLQHLRLPDGTVKVLVEGRQRARVLAYRQSEPFFSAEAEPLEETDAAGAEVEALMRSVRAGFEKYVKLNRKVPPEILTAVGQIQSSGRLADTVAAHLSLKIDERQRLLEIEPPVERLEGCSD
jgi:ATP-dependent Lon protease